MNTKNIEIRGGRVVDPASQFDDTTSVFIADGKIAGIGQTPAGFKADQIVDAKCLVVAPGLVDLSARIAGNIDAELEAAVAGGVTTLYTKSYDLIEDARLAGKQAVERFVNVPFELVTPENMDQYARP